ncbi:hypothetical protein D9M69_653310 [compost metagenome]
MITKRQAHVVLHLLLFVTPQRGEPFGSIPERITQCCCRELPFAALLGDGRWRFQREQRNRLLDTPLAEIDSA